MSGLGRRLPADARFATVEQLVQLPDVERERTAVWLGGEGPYDGWMALDSLLDPRGAGGGRSSLVHAPSHLVVVVKPW